MRISQELFDDMVAHAVADAPNECCGIVSSKDGEATAVYRAINTEASPLRFVIDPKQVYDIHTEIEDAGLDLGAIYHSHTRSEPYPSQTDVNFAAQWPGVQWIIVGTANEDPEVRNYEIRDGEVSDAELEVG